MARKKDIPRVQNPPEGDGHHITTRYMTASELAEREAAHGAYEDMLARQQAAKGESASRIHLPMTHSDIADYAGVTLPAISRAFRSLAARGIAEIRARRHVVILNRSAFAKLAGTGTSRQVT